jgi:ABC-2 type transport system permease protein
MKLFSSFKKELILASRSFYFYVEIFFSLVILAILLFAIPEDIITTSKQYIYLNLPDEVKEKYVDSMFEEAPGVEQETLKIEAGGKTFDAILIKAEGEEFYIVESEDAVKTLAYSEQTTGAVIELDNNNQLFCRYYLQGYESARLKNLLTILFNEDMYVLEERIEEQKVVSLIEDYQPLNDRENTVPPLVAFTSGLMGMFIMASYIFLDKNEGVIKAYAVTASPVWQYLMSKVFVALLTSVVSALIIVIPVIGFKINYGLLIFLLLTTGFFASSLGLLIASFYDNITKAFSVIYILLILLMVPSIAYFIPGWDPFWVKIIPTYPMLASFKEIISPGGNYLYPLIVSGGFLVAGVVIFALTNIRFKKTMSI